METFFYIVIGLGPSIVIILCGHEFVGMNELKTGGLIYLLGICFFKADGSVPFAHAIWHLFVVMASGWHYYAILYYLYPITNWRNEKKMGKKLISKKFIFKFNTIKLNWI